MHGAFTRHGGELVEVEQELRVVQDDVRRLEAAVKDAVRVGSTA